jgi:hypothetical protein
MFRKKPGPPEETRHFTHGAGGAMADAATEASPRREDHSPDSPHAQPVRPLLPNETPDQLADKASSSESRDEARLDEAVEESFPASDPPSANHFT